MSPRSLLIRLWLAVFAGYLGLGATLQELPGFLQRDFGGGTFMIGATVGLAFVGTAVGRPFAGRAGDVGRSRQVGIAGGAMTSIGAAGQFLAPDLGALLAARIVMGLGEAALFSATFPRVLALGDAAQSGRVSGWFGLSMWSGLSIGPLLAAVLGATAGSTAVWSAVMVLPLLSVALIASTPGPRGRPEPMELRDWRRMLPPQVVGPGVTLGLAAFGYGTLAAILVVSLRRPGVGGQSVGLALFSTVFLLSRATGSPLVDRFGGSATARAGVLIEATGLALLALAGSAAVALTGAAVTGAGLGIVYPATTKQTLGRVPTRDAGGAVGAMTSFWDLGILVAGPLSGALAAGVGFGVAFAGAAIAAMAAGALTLSSRSPRHQTSARFESPPGCDTASRSLPRTPVANPGCRWLAQIRSPGRACDRRRGQQGEHGGDAHQGGVAEHPVGEGEEVGPPKPR